MLEMMYLGLKYFRMPFETARVMPAVVSDEGLRTMKVPRLLLIGEHEVISDPARAGTGASTDSKFRRRTCAGLSS
jgi:hypothetical protein